ncbi:SDR family NAD(P)-dependent oxidoreductase [Nocardioides panacisoli]|uniref:SDR family NAD(P)-dependent oxidoreductase n=1 Tax=Nocardioides panacisoli TaxID=627624 RepID=A0ABP7J525_9ACTN
MSDTTPTESGPPPVVVVVGAGPGVGASVARRFAREGYAVGLVARNAERLAAMAQAVRDEHGVPAASRSADATDPAQVRRAVRELTEELGPATVLCFTPLPDVGLIRPVLQTSAEDLLASLSLSVGGAAAAVETVHPQIEARGGGSLLFTTGSGALRPHPDRAASAVTTTAVATYIELLHRALEGTPVRVGHTTIVGPIGSGPDAHHPDRVAEDLWSHHTGAADTPATVLQLPDPPVTS